MRGSALRNGVTTGADFWRTLRHGQRQASVSREDVFMLSLSISRRLGALPAASLIYLQNPFRKDPERFAGC